MKNLVSKSNFSKSVAEGKKSSPTIGLIPIPSRREKTAGFVLKSGAQ